MLEISEETEALVKAKAAKAGVSPDEVVRSAVNRVGDILSWRNAARPRPTSETKTDLIAGMAEICARSAARPVVDPRSADEIIGYDDFGLPR